MTGMPESKPIEEVEEKLEHSAFYVVHGETDGDDNHGWRVAWWDKDDKAFYDTCGELVYRTELKVIPHPLPTFPS